MSNRTLVLISLLLASAGAVSSTRRQTKPNFIFDPSAAAPRVVSASGAKVCKPAPKPKAQAGTGSTKKAGKKPAVAVAFGDGGDGTTKFPTDLGKIKYLWEQEREAVIVVWAAIYRLLDARTKDLLEARRREEEAGTTRKRASGRAACEAMLRHEIIQKHALPHLTRFTKIAKAQKWWKEDSSNQYYRHEANWVRTFCRVLDSYLAWPNGQDMSCLFGLETAMIRVVGTPPTAAERDALTRRSRTERAQCAEVFLAERAAAGSRFPWGGILVYCSLPESAREHGEIRAGFDSFDYVYGVARAPVAGGFRHLISTMSDANVEVTSHFFSHTISLMANGEYNGALLPKTASGYKLYAFRSAAAALHWKKRSIYDLDLQGIDVVERCRRDFGLDWRDIADRREAVRDLPALYAGNERQRVGSSALLALPWRSIAEGEVGARMSALPSTMRLLQGLATM